MTTNSRIVKAALQAITADDTNVVYNMIVTAIGAEYRRPLFDTVDNYGAVTGGSGSYDHKAIEPVTNMHDTVLELAALRMYGSHAAVPFMSPLEASRSLFGSLTYAELASRCNISMSESDPPAKKSKRLTLIYRDKGCGLAPKQIPRTIFGLRSTKKDLQWLQGAFGIGGKTTYRNAKAVIVVSRRAPDLLEPDEEDRISIAVLKWEFQGKTQTAYYPVTTPHRPGEDTAVFSVPAAEYPGFEHGTHLALISYGVEGIQVAQFSDERSFYTLLNTRLFEPVLPIGIDRAGIGDSLQNARGLKRRLSDNPGSPPRKTDTETLPFSVDGRTYHLPVTYHVFAPKGEAGARRSYVAQGHALIFTSNGQSHHQWSGADFKDRVPTLHKLSDRIFVIVETDELPIELRSTLFTADRSAMMRTDDALRLEKELSAFLKEWDDLKDVHADIVRKALSEGQASSTGVNLARELGRAFRGLGFGTSQTSTTTGGNGGNGQRPGKAAGAGNGTGPNVGSGSPTVPIPLYQDPTSLDGPDSVVAVRGESKFIHYRLNAVDGFVPNRSSIAITSNNVQVGERELTVGRLSKGRFRVSIAIPEDVDEGEIELTVTIPSWLRSSGGLGGPLTWTTIVDVVAEAQLGNGNRSAKGRGRQDGAADGAPGTGDGTGAGDMVPVIWKNSSDGWTANTVGNAEKMAANVIAAQFPQYAELAALGETPIWVLQLNAEYSPFKKYKASSIRDVTELTTQKRQDRYTLGVGTGILALEYDIAMKRAAQMRVDDAVVESSKQAIAAAVLAGLRGYDELARNSGLEAVEAQTAAAA